MVTDGGLDAIEAENVEAARARLELQQAILDNLPDAKVVIDAAGKIIMVNHQTELMFGYHRSGMVGEHVEMLLPERLRSRHLRHRIGFSADPRTRSIGNGFALTALRSDGIEFSVHIMLAPVVVRSGPHTIAVIRRSMDVQPSISGGISARQLIEASEFGPPPNPPHPERSEDE